MLATQPTLSPECIKVAQSFLRLTQAPTDLNALYDLDEALRQTELSAISYEYLKAQPEVAELIRERYLGPVPDPAELLTYPKDSLGYVLAKQWQEKGFEPQFYRQRSYHDDISYITLRRSQTHDIRHIITGFDTDPVGEIGLQAFELAQMRSPLAIPILSLGIVNTLQEPELLNAMMTQMYQGWSMGCQAKSLFAQRWEEQWEKSVETWRSELGIVPIQSA